jgi:uncharacterized protein (TIGR03086 family)
VSVLPTEPPERHRAVAGRFSEVVRGTDDWDGPTPVREWAARDVVRHLVEWFPGFLASGSDVRLAPGPSPDDDPVGAWQHHADAVQAVLDDSTTAGKTFTNPHTGELPLDLAVDRFYTSDVLMHTWDLARASGQEPGLDPDACAEMLVGMQPMDEVLRASGQYGPKVAVSDDAPVADRLMAFVGRDPGWRRP